MIHVVTLTSPEHVTVTLLRALVTAINMSVFTLGGEKIDRALPKDQLFSLVNGRQFFLARVPEKFILPLTSGLWRDQVREASLIDVVKHYWRQRRIELNYYKEWPNEFHEVPFRKYGYVKTIGEDIHRYVLSDSEWIDIYSDGYVEYMVLGDEVARLDITDDEVALWLVDELNIQWELEEHEGTCDYCGDWNENESDMVVIDMPNRLYDIQVCKDTCETHVRESLQYYEPIPEEEQTNRCENPDCSYPWKHASAIVHNIKGYSYQVCESVNCVAWGRSK